MVSLHCNLDQNTAHLMNKERLGMMKKDAILVNAARGPIVDEVALVEHLKANPDFRCARGGSRTLNPKPRIPLRSGRQLNPKTLNSWTCSAAGTAAERKARRRGGKFVQQAPSVSPKP